MVKLCELCGAEAHLHCDADSAYLCRSCDVKFHASNFLFSRHVRRTICPGCSSLTGDIVSGSLSPWPAKITCSCCGCGTSSSSASSCCSSLDLISTSELSSSTTRKTTVNNRGPRRREKGANAVGDGIFVNWCDELGLNGDSRNAVVSLASLALAVGKTRGTKVILAAAFWFGVRNARNTMTCPRLKKVEDVTGVAAGMIRAGEGKLARAVTLQLRRCRMDSEEGWAENDNV
ncbi:unnamed protein product [Brassica rapa]|uniref:B box-type domain-containing protein n=1 Tax=Brassica campestris TaxID=3711 RepID=A0A3P5ZPV8_BRACM|nr:unnamed protein product [Brassica rapa]VDC82142.1 unnamed protein product [Brassica rapa]